MQKMIETSNKLKNMDFNLPNILEIVYDEDKERRNQENKDEVGCLRHHKK